MQLNVVTRGGWCNYCSNTKLCEINQCIICYNKSFGSNEKAKYWSNKNELIPRQVFKVSAKKYLFNCNKCNHEFINDPAHISIGRWCPYCCIPQKQLCGNINCNNCFDKSFASHEKVKYWSNKNELRLEFVLKMGDKKYGLIVINVIMILKHKLKTLLNVNGVHIVIVINCAKIMIV